MKKIKKAIFLLTVILAATLSVKASEDWSDACHVYIIDVEKAEKLSDAAMSSKSKHEAEKIVSKYVTMLGEFKTTVGEEETTTKVYKIPNSNLLVTASVFYTDEMMASTDTVESMSLGLAVANKSYESALVAPNVIQADVTYNEFTDTIRVKTFITINKKRFLIGLQCDCKESKKEKPN